MNFDELNQKLLYSKPNEELIITEPHQISIDVIVTGDNGEVKYRKYLKSFPNDFEEFFDSSHDLLEKVESSIKK